jgi:hypothetical protein
MEKIITIEPSLQKPFSFPGFCGGVSVVSTLVKGSQLCIQYANELPQSK